MVLDFVSKIDGVRYPLGCTTPNCPRRHVPLLALGQFAAADKAELLQSLSHMKGTRVAPMITLIQERNQLVRLVASRRLIMRYFKTPLFLSACCNELDCIGCLLRRMY